MWKWNAHGDVRSWTLLIVLQRKWKFENSPKDKTVPADVKSRILEAARLTGDSMNTQHWRFIIIQDKGNLKRLADDSTTGPWAAGCNFAVIILTDPKVPGHVIDGGRVLQDMQLAVWNMGVGSGIFTGVKADKLRKDFAIPKELEIDRFLLVLVIRLGMSLGRKKQKSTERYCIQ